MVTTGTPATKAGANFSSGPQTGKLKALMWIATPRSGDSTCWARKDPSALRGTGGPSSTWSAAGNSRRPIPE